MDEKTPEESNLEKLPGVCAAWHPTTGLPVLINAGEPGYYPLPLHFDVDAFNRRHGITEAQIRAMLIGAAFGWDSPGANPQQH